MAHKKGHVDLLNDPVRMAQEMLEQQTEAAMRLLALDVGRNPLRDALPQGMTLKRLREILRDA